MKCYLITRSRLAAVVLAALLAACNGSDGSTGGRQPVATVTISPSTANVEVGRTQQFTATMKDANGAALTGRTVAWSSDAASIASVHPTGGLMTGVTVGSARIIATSEGKSDTAAVNVTQVPVATVTVSPATASVQVGQTVALTATLKDAGGNTLTGRTVAWSSDKTSIATVSSSGVVTGVAAGSATITAKSEGKQGTATVTVTSTAAPAFGMTLSPTSLSVQQGKSGTAAVGLTRTGGFTGGVTLAVTGAPTGVTATASPSPATGNTSTLTVAVGSSAAVGSYTLTVRGTGSGVTAQTATLALTVTQVPVATVTVSPATASVQVGQTVALTATLKDAGGNTLTGRTVAWSSDKTSIATVSSSGVVTGVAAGSATITAKSEGKQGTATVTVTAAPTPGFTLTLSPASLSLQQGSSGTSTATIARTGGFTGSVALTVSGAPTGLTATLAPTSTTGNSSTLTVGAASTLAVGSYTLTVNGVVTGVAAGSATITATSEGQKGTAAVTVTAAPTPAFTLTLSPTSLSLQQGKSGTSTATIARTGGFTGSVSLSVSGAPTGLTATLAPTSTTGNSSTLTVAAASTLAVGSYVLTVTGTGSGVASRTATLTVNVTASGGSSTSVTFSYCAESAPIFVAYRDAGGTWRKATASSTNTYTFSLANSGGGLVAITRDGTDSYSWSVIYAKPSELNAASVGSSVTVCDPAPTGKTVRGTVAGLAMFQLGYITLGSAFAVATGGFGSGDFKLDNVPDGVQDLVATRSIPNETFTTFAVDKIIIRRGLNPADGSTLPVLDFGGSEAFSPASASVTLANLGSDDGALLISYITGNTSSFGTFAPFYNASGFTSTAPTRSYYGVPTAKQASDDLHALVAFTTPGDGSTNRARFAQQFFRTVANRTLTLGPDLSVPTVTTAASTPYLRPRAQLPVQSQYNQMGSVAYSQESANRSAAVLMTAGYLAGGATWDLQIPDLSGLAGFDASWGLRAGVATAWSASGFGGTFLFGLPGTRPVDGSTMQFALRSGTM